MPRRRWPVRSIRSPRWVAVVEGYPHEIGETRMNNSFVYNGTRTMYEQAGFEFVRAKGLRNTVMRRTIRPA